MLATNPDFYKSLCGPNKACLRAKSGPQATSLQPLLQEKNRILVRVEQIYSVEQSSRDSEPPTTLLLQTRETGNWSSGLGKRRHERRSLVVGSGGVGHGDVGRPCNLAVG